MTEGSSASDRAPTLIKYGSLDSNLCHDKTTIKREGTLSRIGCCVMEATSVAQVPHTVDGEWLCLSAVEALILQFEYWFLK